ncbi:hypothetical protein GCM10017752_00640 [Streptomyces roseoviridis]
MADGVDAEPDRRPHDHRQSDASQTTGSRAESTHVRPPQSCVPVPTTTIGPDPMAEPYPHPRGTNCPSA